MNYKIVDFIKNFSYTLGANIVAFLVSMIIIMVVPKILGVEDYGYFQLYIFYSSFANFFHFGLPNGIYLRYGGKNFNELNKDILAGQLWMLTIYSALTAVIGFIVIVFTIGIEKQGFILTMTFLCATLIIPREFLLLLFMATNRIKDYVKATILDRMVFITPIILYLIFGGKNYTFLIQADIFGKLIALLWVTYKSRDIVWRKVICLRECLKEAWKNVSAGSKILISNIADLMIIGVTRLGIEYQWDIGTFSKVSFTISISNLMMVVINAVSIVIYPVLRKTPKDDIPKIYHILTNLIMIPLMGCMILFYPVKEILALWLPNYADSLKYAAILFPICIYQSKMNMLVNTYLKHLRKEAWILIINLVSVLLSMLLSLITIFLFKSVPMTMVSIVIVLSLRCYFAEFILSKKIQIKVAQEIILEIFLCIIFIITGWFFESFMGTLIYAAFYLVYLYIKRTEIREIKQEVKSLTISK